jgi:hypothetical protein
MVNRRYRRFGVLTADFRAFPEVDMAQLTPEEKAALAEAPRGAFAVMIVIGILLLAGWLVLYFGRFIVAGPVR